MGYFDTQVARAQRTLADAVAGKGLAKAIKQLQDRSAIKDSLKPLPARGDITGKRQIGKKTGSGTAGDFNELSRAYYGTTQELKSSDGLFTLEYHNLQRLTTDRAIFTFRDYIPT
jgi:hypothetical protein